MVKSSLTPEINALSAILVLISMTLIVASLALQRKELRH
jgi:ABC-type spermidine/putrescine transport system permease subunit II